MSGLLDDAELDAILAESVPPAEPTFVDMPFVAGEVVSAEEMVERLLQLSLTNKALREELAQYKLDQETLRTMLEQCHADKKAISNRKDAIMRRKFRNAMKKSPRLRAAVRDALGINPGASQ
jgi:hypothetical protein